MNPYTTLAGVYDRLMDQTVYDRFNRRITAILRRAGIEDGIVLELCCGTGSLTRLLSLSGYEMIGCDRSPDMLNIAREKCADLPVPPVWICQSAEELDLYGTIRAAVCCMDSVNYFTDLRQLKQVFSRVSLFLEPKGVFIFDVRSKGMFESMNGLSSVQEEDGLFCAWQYGYDRKSGRGVHQVDIFAGEDGGIRRFTELHEQRCYSVDTLKRALTEAGFASCRVYEGLTARPAREENGRLLFVAGK